MKNYNTKKIATNLRTRRHKLGLSRQDLADKAKVNYNTIIKLESGANDNPTVKTLIGIAKVFKTTVEDIIS